MAAGTSILELLQLVRRARSTARKAQMKPGDTITTSQARPSRRGRSSRTRWRLTTNERWMRAMAQPASSVSSCPRVRTSWIPCRFARSYLDFAWEDLITLVLIQTR
jgi:hypothetical protein